MFKVYLTAFLANFIPMSAFAQTSLFQENWYVGLEGNQGDEDVSIELILVEGGRVVGKGCPSVDEALLSYSGKLSGQNLSLNVLKQDTNVGTYTLTPDVRDNYVEGYVGTYEHKATGETESVNLRYSSGFYGMPENRYLDFPGSDADLEDFAGQVIKSFLSGDKNWLSENIALPFLAYAEEGKTLEIGSPDEFIQNYDTIATQSLLQKLSTFATCNLWANHSGVMLGRGEIWIWKGEASTDKSPVFVIKNVKSY